MAPKRHQIPDEDNPATPKRRRIGEGDDSPSPSPAPNVPGPGASIDDHHAPHLTLHRGPISTPDVVQVTREAKLDIPKEEKDAPLCAFSVGQLKRNGYINYQTKPALGISDAFKPEITANNLSNPIHPVFQKSNWPNTDDDTWSSIQPSLQLASRILAEPALQSYFYDIVIRPHHFFDHKGLENLLGQRPTRFGGPEAYTMFYQEHTLRVLFEKLSEMKGVVQWVWSSIGNTTHGETESIDARPGIGGPAKPSSTGSNIHINERYKPHLLPGGMYSELPLTQRLGFGQEEGLLRARLILAITLVHEFSHALFWASKDMPFESFYRDHRIAETGNVLESLLLDGVLEASGDTNINPRLVPGVYGLYLVRFPGAFKGNVLHDDKDNELGRLELMSNDKARKFYHTYYLAPMTWVHQFFTDEFWDGQAARQSLAAFHGERTVGVRVPKPGYKEDDKKANISPLPPQTTLPPSPVDEERPRA